MFHYLVRGLSVPIEVEMFRVEELLEVRDLLVQLEVHPDQVKRRLLIHKIGTVLRATERIPRLARVLGISQGYLANGEKRIFLAFYRKERISDDFDLDTGR